MRFRFTYSHEVEGDFVASEPAGFDDAQLGFERDMEFYSLVEFYKAPFAAYGTNGIDNGARDWIKMIEKNYGADTLITVTSEIAPDNYTYENLYTGTIAIGMFVERIDEDHLLDMAFNQKSFWTSFLSRQDTPVDIQSPVSLDGEAITIIPSTDITLPSQIIDKSIIVSSSIEDESSGLVEGASASLYGILPSFSTETLVELPEYFRPGGSVLDVGGDTADSDTTFFTDNFLYFLKVSDNVVGTFISQLSYVFTGVRDSGTPTTSSIGVKFLMKVKSGSTITTYQYSNPYYDAPDRIVFSYPTTFNKVHNLTQPLTLLAGDEIYIYGVSNPLNTISLNTHSYNFGAHLGSFINFVTKTTFTDSICPSFLLHDVGAMIADRIISKNQSFYSEFLGRTNTLAREYLANGCGSRYILAKGLQIRQYTLSEKPFFLSFNDWWEGVNPILNLGIGYDKATEIVGVYEAVPLPDISTWTETGIGSSWFGTNTTHVENVGLGFGLVESKRKYTPYAFIVGDAYRLTFAHSVVSAGALPVFRRLKVDTVTSGGVNQQRLLTQNSAGTDTVEFTAIAGDDRLSFIVSVQGIDTDNYFTVDLLTIEHFVESEIEVDVIRVEPKSFFFDDSSVSVNLSNIQKITRKYDPEHQFNSFKGGYQKWQSEEISGIDDPQTVRTWASRLKYIGKPLIKLSLFIAASLTWETARRTTKIKSADYKYDNETFIVAVEETGGVFSPELSENFTDVTGLLNEETRYNKRLTVARNFIRHMNLINGALQSYLGSIWRFVSGEGNFDMRSTMTGCAEDFDGIPVSEKQDFEVTDNFLFLPVIYEIEHYLTFTQYKLIKANRNKAIGLSLTTAGHKKAFIKSLSVNPVTGDLSLIVWAKEELDLSVATKPATPGRIFDFTFVTEFE